MAKQERLVEVRLTNDLLTYVHDIGNRLQLLHNLFVENTVNSRTRRFFLDDHGKSVLDPQTNKHLARRLTINELNFRTLEFVLQHLFLEAPM